MTHIMEQAFLWFTGGRSQYHTLVHCMREDWFWIVSIVVVDLFVLAGYIAIAFHWRKHQSDGDSLAEEALADLKWVFILCGCATYLWTFIDTFWPAWRLMFFVKSFLVYKTWRFVVIAPRLEMIYHNMNRVRHLEHELEMVRHQRDSLLEVQRTREL